MSRGRHLRGIEQNFESHPHWKLADGWNLANSFKLMSFQVDDFQEEIAQAVRNFDRFVICIDQTPEDFLRSLRSLLKKAITAYADRGPGLRHGRAIDRHVTVMLSQTESDRPLCGIYFNLHSPYQRQVQLSSLATQPHQHQNRRKTGARTEPE